ncbi:transglutaminase-like domain-containing protein, partial [Anaerobutyricum soehngenii]|uniref:transglutaminase-like domain-containing protein n=1 Tax=Anaerobutyricum soehngenii TaxID=105843 RepID=UPI0032C07E94
MKKSTMLATAAFAVLLGLFVPCTSHATEIKDTDPTTVQWDKATVEEKTDADNDKYLLYTLPNTNYDSYDDAITGLAKYMVDATADRKYNSVSVLFPFTVVTDKTIDEAVDMSVDIDDKIDSWIRFGDNMTKREILSFSGSDWKKHENLSSFNTNIIDWKKTENGYSGLAVCAVEYSPRYDFTEYETKCLNAIKEMNVDGKSDYDKALALCKWVNKHIKYKSSEVFLGDQSGMQGMMEGWGVCNAYATLTCYLGRCLGLDILYEGGDTWLDSHAWNLVKVGDEWYYMDPTKSGHEEDLLFNISFLQGNDWLKCNTKELDDQFKDYNKIYNISDISYANKHSNCEHNWIESPGGDVTANIKDSTCDLPYNVPYRCTKCNAVKWEYYKDPKGHTPGKVIRVDREANCYTEGLQVRECTVCGKGYWETIPMTQHHWVDG